MTTSTERFAREDSARRPGHHLHIGESVTLRHYSDDLNGTTVNDEDAAQNVRIVAQVPPHRVAQDDGFGCANHIGMFRVLGC